MCGIFGSLARQQAHAADLALVEQMAQRLAHRGPDGYGTWANGPFAFGAGRLAIIDLSAPAGPLFNETQTIGVAFNGEIYNYRNLRQTLEQAGHVFATQTDTEVIVHGYEQWGVDVFTQLRGMFGIAIWDLNAQRLVLGRDRLGEKPLYYTQTANAFLFASEIKALLESPAVPRRVEAQALPSYLTLGYTVPPFTMFEGIFKLAPGEMLIIEATAQTQIPQPIRYWTPTMDTRRADQPYEGAVKAVRAAVFDAVESRLMSDVPLGAFLSGGVDSTAVVAIMAQLTKQPVRTFTVGFDDNSDKFNVDDKFASIAAAALNTEHRRISLRQDESLAALLPQLLYHLDEPIAQPAIIQTVHVAALARLSGVPVLLSGDAGDELFAGYPSYRADQTLARYLKIPSLVRNSVLTPLLEHMPARFDSVRKLASKSRITDPFERYVTWMKMVEPERQLNLMASPRRDPSAYTRFANRLRPILAAPETAHFADRIAFASLNWWIAEDSNMRVDKMSMAMSMEARAPLEDHLLVELALRLPLEYKLRDGDFKRVLKDAVRDLVPPSILERPKWGFFPPISNWLRTIFRPLVDRYLSRDYVAAVGWFDPDAVQRIVHAHIVERKYELWPLYTLLVFHIWHALYIDGSLQLDHKLVPSDFAELV